MNRVSSGESAASLRMSDREQRLCEVRRYYEGGMVLTGGGGHVPLNSNAFATMASVSTRSPWTRLLERNAKSYPPPSLRIIAV